MESVSWNEFFQKFDEKKLAFLYQDQTADGKESRFFKFVNRGMGEDLDDDSADALEEEIDAEKEEGDIAPVHKKSA